MRPTSPPAIPPAVTSSPPDFIALLPPYLPLKKFCETFNHSRSRAYQLLGEKKLRGKKDGDKLIIETESELERLASLPDANIKPVVRGAA
jgi:hypothetical protein